MISAAPIDVMQSIAEAPAGAVGCYVMGTGTACIFGGVIAGSSISPVGAYRAFQSGYGLTVLGTDNATLTGSWQCQGRQTFSNTATNDTEQNQDLSIAYGCTIFKRVS
jgi:hypothetical protein